MKIKEFFIDHLIIFRVIAAVIAFGLIIAILIFANGLVGNPVSYLLVKNSAEKILAEGYADEGYMIESVNFNFKAGNYYVYFSKPDSEDSRFFESFGFDGKQIGGRNNIDDQIKGNVRRRLEMSYREQVDSVFKSPFYPYSGDTYVRLIFEPFSYEGSSDGAYDFSLPMSILVPDGLYDIADLGEKAGLLTIYVNTGEPSPEKATEVLLTIDSLMKQGGVTFFAISLTLVNPGGDYIVENFHRGDIYENGLLERVKEKGMTGEEYYAKKEAEEEAQKMASE